MTELEQMIQLQCDRIRGEVTRSIQLHAPMNSLHEAYAVILEELDEFWEMVKVNPKKLDFDAHRKRLHDMQVELIQIAAMCIRATIDCDLIRGPQ